MDTFSLGLRDLALLSGLLGTWFAWWINAKRRAVEVATWRTNQERDIAELRREIERRHSADDAERAENKRFREDMYAALREIRDRLTRLEAKRNGG